MIFFKCLNLYLTKAVYQEIMSFFLQLVLLFFFNSNQRTLTKMIVKFIFLSVRKCIKQNKISTFHSVFLKLKFSLVTCKKGTLEIILICFQPRLPKSLLKHFIYRNNFFKFNLSFIIFKSFISSLMKKKLFLRSFKLVMTLRKSYKTSKSESSFSS